MPPSTSKERLESVTVSTGVNMISKSDTKIVQLQDTRQEETFQQSLDKKKLSVKGLKGVTVPTGVNEKPKLDTLSGKYVYKSDIPSKTLENGETVPSIRDKKRLLTNTVPPDLIRSSRRKDLTGRKVGVIRRGVEPEGVNYMI